MKNSAIEAKYFSLKLINKDKRIRSFKSSYSFRKPKQIVATGSSCPSSTGTTATTQNELSKSNQGIFFSF